MTVATKGEKVTVYFLKQYKCVGGGGCIEMEGEKEEGEREEELIPFKPNHLEQKFTPGFGM